MGKRTPTERIASLREKIAQKRTNVEGYNITLSNTQKKKDAANKAIEGYEKQISALETDLLAKALHDKGINISDVAAAIEAGLFDNSVPEKPPDKSEKEPETNGATYSTENTTAESGGADEKEDLDNE
ncbi:MAG: hypothetical protein NC299_18220 [Lachnospiraceae bacterium]|nr:hypothetical protein [Lachnospiraceae bacterium]MCM1277265.1 hypothetical protein [Lachnospiraceae bacterium]